MMCWLYTRVFTPMKTYAALVWWPKMKKQPHDVKRLGRVSVRELREELVKQRAAL